MPELPSQPGNIIAPAKGEKNENMHNFDVQSPRVGAFFIFGMFMADIFLDMVNLKAILIKLWKTHVESGWMEIHSAIVKTRFHSLPNMERKVLKKTIHNFFFIKNLH